jgi:hypothetical protein
MTWSAAANVVESFTEVSDFRTIWTIRTSIRLRGIPGWHPSWHSDRSASSQDKTVNCLGIGKDR